MHRQNNVVKYQFGRLALPDFKTYYNPTIMKLRVQSRKRPIYIVNRFLTKGLKQLNGEMEKENLFDQ